MSRRIISGIYCLKNKINEKMYIGSSTCIIQRYANHLSALRRGIHTITRLQKDVNEFGLENFELIIIEELPKEELLEREDFYIELYNTRQTGYNIEGATGRGKLSKEHREKISQKLKGRISPTKGLTQSIETREKDLNL